MPAWDRADRLTGAACLAAVPEGQAFVEPYGLPSPIPEHDGTECLKWDPSLWSHADHFKVRCQGSIEVVLVLDCVKQSC